MDIWIKSIGIHTRERSETEAVQEALEVIHRDKAATVIQAVRRGRAVRKTLVRRPYHTNQGAYRLSYYYWHHTARIHIT